MNTAAVTLTLLTVLHCVMSAGVRAKAPRGGNASVHCPYSRGSENYPKYFSKGRNKTQIVKVNRDRTRSTDSRFSLEDDRERREFTVTIRNLSEEDAGQYWCGVDNWGADKLTEVNLDVFQPSTETPPTQNGVLEYVTRPPTQAAVTSLSPSGHQNIWTSVIGEPLVLGGLLAGAVLLCGIISGILMKVKWKKAERTTGTLPTSSQSRENTNSGHGEDDYERMIPVTPVNSSSPGPHSHQYTEPADPQDSNVYQELRAQSKQDSVYHTLHLTSR